MATHEWQKISANRQSDLGFISGIHKELCTSQQTKKPNTLILKCTKYFNRHLSKENIRMPSEHMKRGSTSEVIREMQIKAAVRHHSHPLAVFSRGSKMCWWGWVGHIVRWWECNAAKQTALQKLKNRITTESRNCTCWYTPKRTESKVSKRYLFTQIHSNFIPYSQKVGKSTDSSGWAALAYTCRRTFLRIRHTPQHGWTWRTLCWVRSARHGRTKMVRRHLDEVPGRVKFTETESGTAVAGVWRKAGRRN